MTQQIESSIHLLRNRGFKWHTKGNCHVKGHLWYKSDYYTDDALADLFFRINNKNQLLEILRNVSGLYSVIIHTPSLILLAVDRVCTIPLYYTVNDGKLMITDDMSVITGKRMDQFQVNEFLATGHTHGTGTLLQEVSFVTAGTVVEISSSSITSVRYGGYSTSAVCSGTYTEQYETAKKLIDEVFCRYFKATGNRPVCIPLSGGFDSRLIALMAKRYCKGDVLCFTYGRKGCHESEISKKTAGILDLRWHMVIYNEQRIAGYLRDPLFYDYAGYAAGMTSMFFMQEYFAIKALKEELNIPVGAIIMPGHSGDFLGGSQLRKYRVKQQYNAEQLAAKIIRDKYNLVYPGNEHIRQIKKLIIESIRQYPENTIPYSIYEDIDLTGKLSKFTVRLCSVYDYFGYRLMLPYFDTGLLDFFSKLPYRFKCSEKMYNDVLINEYFKPAGLFFTTDRQITPQQYRLQQFKNIIRSLLPAYFLQRNLRKHDWHYYSEITGMMMQDMKNKGRKPRLPRTAYNSTIVQWYIHHLEEKGFTFSSIPAA